MNQDISKKAMELFDAHYDVWKSTGVCISKCKDKNCRLYNNDCGAWQIYARISATMSVEFARENSLNTSDNKDYFYEFEKEVNNIIRL
jgi:hypothetical protein